MNVPRDTAERKLSATEIKQQLQQALTLCRELVQQCGDSLNELDNLSDEAAAQKVALCETIQKETEKAMVFLNTPSKRTDILNKLLRVERKKRWKLKKRRLERVKGSFFRSMLRQRNQQLDQWRQKREEQIEREVEEENRRNAVFERQLHVQELLKQRNDLQKLLLAVDSLRQIRVGKLRKQGYTDCDVKDPIEDGLLKRCKEDVANYKEVKVSKKKMEWTFVSEEKEESDHDYYYGAEMDINKLIAVRRAWDMYLVPRGRGSRIPTHFVEPPSRPWVS